MTSGSPSPSASQAISTSPRRTRCIACRFSTTMRRESTDATVAAMDDKFITLTPALYEYVLAHNPPRDAVLEDLARETAGLGGISVMQIAHEQGTLLTMLAGLLG